MTKENVIHLNLNVEEVDGPPCASFEVNRNILNTAKETYHIPNTKFTYITYAIGFKKVLNNKNIDETILKVTCKKLIKNLYSAAFYQKPECYEANYDLKKPLIVWRKRPGIEYAFKAIQIYFRLVIIPPQEVEMVKEFLKSWEKPNG